MRVYLAGPDVFLPNAQARGAALKSVCAAHSLIGVFPLDELAEEPAEWAGLPEFQRISLRNEAHIRGCDALIANLTPFRGPSADVGTVFELGFARALGLPVFGWSVTTMPFLERTRTWLGRQPKLSEDGTSCDAEGLALENFGCVDNLMIDGAIRSSGGSLITLDAPDAMRWGDLVPFAACVAAAAKLLRGAMPEDASGSR